MIVELLPKIAAMANAEEEREHKYYPRPSSAGPERCTRQMVYYRLGKEQQESGDRKYLVFDSSSWHEELVADWIRQSPYSLHSEQMKVDLGLNITGYNFPLGGSIDGIIQDMMGVERLWENKAINHFSFERYWTAEPDDLDALPWDNICQACIYCAGLQREQDEITEILLILKNKNTDNLIEYRIEYHGKEDVAYIHECCHSLEDPKEMGALVYFPVSYCVDKFERVEQHAQDGTLPIREYEMDHWRCDYCPYQEMCWKGFMEEMDELGTGYEFGEGEIADACRYYKEVSAQETEIKKEKKMLSTWLKTLMKFLGVKEGKAGEYVLKMSGKITQQVEKKLIPPEIMPQVSKTYYSDTLRINKPAPKKEKKPKKKKEKTNGK